MHPIVVHPFFVPGGEWKRSFPYKETVVPMRRERTFPVEGTGVSKLWKQAFPAEGTDERSQNDCC